MGATGNNNQIDNIEFNVADITRSKRFYGDVFGWTFTDYGPSYCEFSDGRLTGGFTTGEAVRPGGPLVILYGDDLAAIRQRIIAAGGRISRSRLIAIFCSGAARLSPAAFAVSFSRPFSSIGWSVFEF